MSSLCVIKVVSSPSLFGIGMLYEHRETMFDVTGDTTTGFKVVKVSML